MISLRLMEDTMEDYKALQSWFHEPELQEFVWCDEKGEPPVSLERIIEKYGERVKHPKDVLPYFILRDGEAIGFIQYYLQDALTIGLDMWIGQVADRSRGYEKAGFVPESEFIDEEGDPCLMMTIRYA